MAVMVHPKPEIIGKYKVVYPIFRDDIAEAVLIPEVKTKIK